MKNRKSSRIPFRSMGLLLIGLLALSFTNNSYSQNMLQRFYAYVNQLLGDKDESTVRERIEKVMARLQRALIPTPQKTASSPTPPADFSAEELARPIAIADIAPAQGAFGAFFDSVVHVDEASNNIFQRSLKIVKDKLNEKTRLAQKALQSVGEIKQELLMQAEKAYKAAINQANNLIASVKKSGQSFIEQALKELFAIDYKKAQTKISELTASLARVQPSLNALSKAFTWKQLERVQTNWNAVQKKGFALKQNLTPFLTQLAGRKKAREGWWGFLGQGTFQQESREKKAELMRNYPLAYKFDFLLEAYPKFLRSIEQTDVALAGVFAQRLLTRIAQVFEDTSELYTASGTWGKLLLTNDMVAPLKALGTQMGEVGKELKAFALSDPLEQLVKELPKQLNTASIGDWLKAIAWHPHATVVGVKDIITTQTPLILDAQNQLNNALQKTTALSDTFVKHSTNMLQFIKQSMVDELSQKPFQNYLNVAKQAVAKEAKISKELFNDVLLYTAGIVNYLGKMLTPFIATIERVNDMLGKELITTDNIETLQKSAKHLKEMTQALARLRNAAKESLNI